MAAAIAGTQTQRITLDMGLVFICTPFLLSLGEREGNT